jgi:hypothetical protein
MAVTPTWRAGCEGTIFRTDKKRTREQNAYGFFFLGV